MKQWVILLVLAAGASSSQAQLANFQKAVHVIRQQIFSSDTALYNEKTTSYLTISKNGNVQVATCINPDTLHFNLLLLHPILLDSNGIYNHNGFNLYESSLSLFVEETMQQDELNEKGETIVIAHATARL